MTHRVLLSSLLLSATSLAPAKADTLSLPEAMATARVQAQEVLAAHARAEAGDARVKQAKGYRLPQISFQELWIRTNSPAEVFALQLNQGRFSFEDFVVSDPNNPDFLTNATSRFLLTLPIYTGGEVSGRVNQANLAAEAATIQAIWAENSAALAAAEAYIQLSQARENAKLLEQVLATVDTHVQLAQAFVDQGMLVRSELLRAEVERSRIEDLFLEAQGQAQVAEANLSFRLGADPAAHWELDKLGDPTAIDEDLAHWMDTAETRSDLQAARRMLDAAELEIKVERSGLRPKIGMAARYDMFSDQLFNSDHDSAAIMGMLSIDLFSGNRHRAAKAAAEADFAAGQQQITQLAEGIRLEVRAAYERAMTARKRFATAAAAQQAALEAERITEERFKEGVVRMIDLVDATAARQEAETRELVARSDAHLATLALAVKSGQQPEAMLTASQTTPARSPS